ncbi:hypothetical protein C8R47DRAFT_1077161 [Mycena vitilis]|nr:hypothetical protein C8R47DRAFT_1077161 [Mycena vitilis]
MSARRSPWETVSYRLGQRPRRSSTRNGSISLDLSDDTSGCIYQYAVDRRGTSMPDGLWDIVRQCWRYYASERPTGTAVVHILAAITDAELPGRRHEGEAAPIPASSKREHDNVWKSSSPRDASPRTRRALPPDSRNLRTTIPPGTAREEVEKPLPSAPRDSRELLSNDIPSVASSSATKKPIIQSDDQVLLTVVRFGPLDVGSQAQHERVFSVIFKALRQLVGPDALLEPEVIHPHGKRYIDLCFRSALEANGFAMTWGVHGAELYPECSAVVVKTNPDIVPPVASE